MSSRATPECRRAQYRRRTKWRRELRRLGASREEATRHSTGIERMRAFKRELEGRKR